MADTDARFVSMSFSLLPPLKIQIILAGALAGLADWLFFGRSIGISYTLFMLALAIGMAAANAGSIRLRDAMLGIVILIAALLPGLETFNSLTASFGIVGLVTFTLMIHRRWTGDVLARLQAAGAFVLQIPIGFAVDAGRVFKVSKRRSLLAEQQPRLQIWVVPIVFSLIFLGLFSNANPLIEQWLTNLDFTAVAHCVDVARISFWCIAAALCWPFIRRRSARKRPASAGVPVARAPRHPPAYVDLFAEPAIFRALLLFNLLFAVQIGLDAAYLWAGTELPDGMTYARYAHRGAYTLICTALLAAAFVLFATRPGSACEASRRVRALVLIWTLQNLLLVVFSIHRLGIYVEAYALTYWRVAAFIWMALVFVGLGLIIAREVMKRTSTWLIEMNLVSLAAVLFITSFVNLPSLIAHYNASAVLGWNKPRLDIVYLTGLGAQAIPVLDRIIDRMDPGDPARVLRTGLSRYRFLIRHRNGLAVEARSNAKDWRWWSLRRQRLQRYLDTAGTVRLPMRRNVEMLCDAPDSCR